MFKYSGRLKKIGADIYEWLFWPALLFYPSLIAIPILISGIIPGDLERIAVSLAMIVQIGNVSAFIVNFVYVDPGMRR